MPYSSNNISGPFHTSLKWELQDMDLKANAADSIGPLTVNLQQKKRVPLVYLIVRGGIDNR